MPVAARLSTLMLSLVLAGCANIPRPKVDLSGLLPNNHVELNFVALNDFHGNLEPSRYSYDDGKGKQLTTRAGGIETISGALQAWRREDKELLFVSAGDLVGASPALSSMWADEPTIELMNMLGLSVSALGNHEFDPGRKELMRHQKGGCDSPRADKACKINPQFGGARFNFLSANVIDRATGQPLVPGWRIEQVKGVKVGLVSAVLRDTPSVAVASSIAGLSFGDEADAINKALPAMRAQGAKVFVALVHEGGYTDEAPDKRDCSRLKGNIVDIVRKLDPAISLVITGHTHDGFACKVDGRTVTQAAKAGHLLSRIRMKVDPDTGKVARIDVRNVMMKPGMYKSDPRVAAYMATLRERSRAALARPVARLGVASIARPANLAGESQLGNVIADAVLAATREQGAQIGFMNMGGIRKDLEAGADLTTTFGQAQAVLPFGNTLVLVDMTGAEIRALLEQQWTRAAGADPALLQVSQGFSFQWDPERPAGSRVVPGSVRLGGAPLEDNKTYRVVANNFLAEGGDGFTQFARVTRKVDTGMRDIDALIAYLAANPGLGAPAGAMAPAARIEKLQ